MGRKTGVPNCCGQGQILAAGAIAVQGVTRCEPHTLEKSCSSAQVHSQRTGARGGQRAELPFWSAQGRTKQPLTLRFCHSAAGTHGAR